MATRAPWQEVGSAGQLVNPSDRAKRTASRLLRAIAMAISAFALAWGIAGTGGLVAAMFGAAIGVLVGDRLGRSEVRLSVVLGTAALIAAFSMVASGVAIHTELVPRLVGPGTALGLASMARFGALALASTMALRALAARKSIGLAIELAVVALAIAAAFAAHRDGVIARPLWLSDWAWREGVDPTQILLGVGCLAVGLLAILLLVETRSGRGVSSLVVLTALATIAAMSVGVAGVPRPDPISDLGLKVTGDGDPPPPPPPDASDGTPERGGDAGDKDGGGQDGGGQDAGADGGGQDAGADGGGQGQDGGDGGQGEDAGLDGGGSSNDGGDGGDQVPANERPQDSSQDQLDQSEGQRGAAAPVAVVILENDYSPPAQAYYFREDALSQFNGARLVAGSRGDVDLDIVASHPSEQTPVRGAPSEKGRARVRARVAMLTEHSRPFGLETPTSFAPIKNPNPQRFARAYRFEALAQGVEYKTLFGKKPGDSKWPLDVLAYYTTAPTDPRYAELAKSIVARLPPSRKDDPFAKALAIKIALDQMLTYSTKARHAGAVDPTAEMLFGDKIGYCVHFAHAATFLWRSVGVPARVAVGYRTEEDQRKGGSTVLVRSGDAHAWPELYLDGIGWIVLDIAAARNLDPPQPAQDDELQKLLGEMARDEPPDPEEKPEETKKRKQQRGNFGRDIGIAGLVLLAAALAVLYGIKIWRRFAPVIAGSRAMPRVGYRAALDVLAEAGLARSFGETREAFAKRIKAVAPSFEKMTEMHVAARLRNPELDPAQREELQVATWKKAIGQLKGEVGRGAKLWRRLLGFFNPASFLDAK